jgi:uncharacterized protein YkwD
LTGKEQRGGAFSGLIIVLAVVFVLLVLGTATWTLWGSHITDALTDFYTGLLPSSPRPSPQGQPTENPTPVPSTPPAETQAQPPVYQDAELIEYALELINRDRISRGLQPVTLGNNAAAQRHAGERLENRYLSHWGMDGLKPYMRYTTAGGTDYEAENGFIIESTWSPGMDPSYRLEPEEMLERAQESLMSSKGHRQNILNKWHRKVNLGIAYNAARLDLVQQFEGDFIDFIRSPRISGNILSMVGKVKHGAFKDVVIYYDLPPQPLSPAQLARSSYSGAYGLGESIGNILAPPAPGYYYAALSPGEVVAMTWNIGADGSFAVEADISTILTEGPGVYTIGVWAEADGEYLVASNYSIFVE